VAALPSPPFTVGFAAETDNEVAYARGKLQAKRLSMIVANRAQDMLSADEGELTVVDAEGAGRRTAGPAGPAERTSAAGRSTGQPERGSRARLTPAQFGLQRVEVDRLEFESAEVVGSRMTRFLQEIAHLRLSLGIAQTLRRIAYN